MEALQGDRPADAVPVSFAKTPEMSSLPVWDALQLRLAITAAGVALWSWNVDTNRFTMDQTAFRLCGVQLSESVTFDDLSSHIHPADRDRVKAAFAATRLEMTVLAQQDKLIAYYERRGFRRTGETRPFPADPRYARPLRDDLYFAVLEKPLP